MNEDGWFEIEEEFTPPCGCPGCNYGRPMAVKKRIRFTGPPSRAAERWLTEATRDNRTDPRLLGPTAH